MQKWKLFTRLFLSFLLFGCTLPTGKKILESDEKILSETQLLEDLTIFRASLEEGHGGLYRYTSQEEMVNLFDALTASINGPLSERSFLQKLSKITAQINDGHTRIKGPDTFEKKRDNWPIHIPFKFSILKNKVYLFRNYSEFPDLKMGAEVIKINGKKITNILQEIKQHLSSDGFNETSKNRYLESTLNFARYFYLLYGKNTSFKLKVRPLGEKKTTTVQVKGITKDELSTQFEARYPDLGKPTPPGKFEIEDSIGLLTIRTFGGSAYYQAGMDFSDFLNDTFSQLKEKEVEHLIIDLRNNGGGTDAYGKMLFAHLTDKPFDYYRYLEVNHQHFDFLAFTNVPDQDIPAAYLSKNDRGTYDVLNHPNLGQQSPLQPSFQGKVYILINGGSFSATSEFTSITHFHKRAVFIGEEGGGGYYGNTSGFVPQLVLPQSGIKIGIPLMKYTMAVEGYKFKNRGLVPDYEIIPEIRNILDGRDLVLDFTKELILKEK